MPRATLLAPVARNSTERITTLGFEEDGRGADGREEDDDGNDDELLPAEEEEREDEPRDSFCISALNSPKEAASLSIAVATAQSSLLFSMMVLLLP